ncbi:hypothetical protein [Lentisalinibacter orientalis]|uniref:hypothetical protein n=1 Tax=Lentisalinibacter orientalis TaxID=2992241 RepID=UPI0038707A3D
MEIAWIEYALLVAGLCFVLIGLYERFGRDRLARRLKLAPGEAEGSIESGFCGQRGGGRCS